MISSTLRGRARRAGAVALAALLGAAAPVGARAQFGTNLVVNPGAEAAAGGAGEVVPIPGWSTVGNFTAVLYGTVGGFPDLSSPGPADRGANFFAGGPGPASSAAQTIDLAALGIADAIDAGQVTYDLSGWFGGFSTQGDNASLLAEFLDGGGTAIGAFSLGGFTPADRGTVTGLLRAEQAGSVFGGTRSIRLTLSAQRLNGNYNDGYADNLSLILRAGAVRVIPEPSTLVLAAVGCAVLAAGARRRARG